MHFILKEEFLRLIDDFWENMFYKLEQNKKNFNILFSCDVIDDLKFFKYPQKSVKKPKVFQFFFDYYQISSSVEIFFLAH